jgi:hypothetical protein
MAALRPLPSLHTRAKQPKLQTKLQVLAHLFAACVKVKAGYQGQRRLPGLRLTLTTTGLLKSYRTVLHKNLQAEQE